MAVYFYFTTLTFQEWGAFNNDVYCAVYAQSVRIKDVTIHSWFVFSELAL